MKTIKWLQKNGSDVLAYGLRGEFIDILYRNASGAIWHGVAQLLNDDPKHLMTMSFSNVENRNMEQIKKFIGSQSA